eukprot:6208622-Pleurochrysis_carterae.AAC.1
MHNLHGAGGRAQRTRRRGYERKRAQEDGSNFEWQRVRNDGEDEVESFWIDTKLLFCLWRSLSGCAKSRRLLSSR